MSLSARLSSAVIGALLLTTPASAEPAVELVMFERAGCAWCARWMREVEPIYAKTDTGKAVPLRRIDLGRDKSQGVILNEPVRFTPTFVLVKDGREVGRITGYVNDAMFWGLFDKLAAQTIDR